MKKTIFIFTALIACLTAFCGQSIEKSFTPDDSIIENPGQGLMLVSKRIEGLPFGACYTRVLWADLEPEEGKYDWSKIDKAISWGEKNKIPASFRIMCANYHSKGRYSTPEWVFKKGVKSSEFSWEKKDQIPSKPMTTLVRVTPHFDDPIFIKEHSKFIKKLAERYDGDPRIAFIDIGSYGNWGEWHTHRLGIPKPDPKNLRRHVSGQFQKNPSRIHERRPYDSRIRTRQRQGISESRNTPRRRRRILALSKLDWL